MKQLVEVLCVFAALALFASACAPQASASVAQSSVQRVTNPDVPADDLSALVQGNNTFALDLYGTLRSGDGNLAFSPYSLFAALAMPYAGASGDTASQMAQALHYALPQERLHAAFNRLDLNLTRDGKPTSSPKQPFQLNIANAVWSERTFSFLPDYLDILARNYGAGIQLADFLKQPEPVRRQINAWVSQKTNGKIQDLIPSGALDPRTKMVLVNALYFKADWEQPFAATETRDAPFTLLDGTQVQSKQMSNRLIPTVMPYASGDGYQVVELAYSGNTAAMDILVPDAGRYEEFESSFDAQKWDGILRSMQPIKMEVGLPKFTVRSSFDLGDQLASLGMPDAFDLNRANFSGMTGKPDLFISKVLHEAYVAVDEKGTEAAAATGIMMAPTSAMQPPQKLLIDRPFIYLIRELNNGQILFLGRVLDPSK